MQGRPQAYDWHQPFKFFNYVSDLSPMSYPKHIFNFSHIFNSKYMSDISPMCLTPFTWSISSICLTSALCPTKTYVLPQIHFWPQNGSSEVNHRPKFSKNQKNSNYWKLESSARARLENCEARLGLEKIRVLGSKLGSGSSGLGSISARFWKFRLGPTPSST